jgi:spermidine synthase
VAQRTLGKVFSRVLILPGGRVFFLASDGTLTADVARRMEQAGVRTRLVNRDYLKGMLTADRMADLRRAISTEAPLNEDFSPILYYYHLRYWMSQFQVRWGIFEVLLVVPFLIYLIRLRPVPLAVFCGGFAASALEVVLLLAFQVLFGSLYYQVGLIITTFMLGLVIGALLMNRWRMWPSRPRQGEHADTSEGGPAAKRIGKRRLAYLAMGVAVFAACLPLALLGLERSEGPAALVIDAMAIPLLTLLLAVLVGMEFPLAARVDFQDPAATSARLYAADYLGAALGALLVSTLLIPLLGVFMVCFLTAGLNLLAAGIMLVIRRD